MSLALRLTADPCPDASGFVTLREYDGSEHGDTSAQPVATVYDDEHARVIAERVNAYPELLAALDDLFEHCAMVHKHWGDGSNKREADTAIERARAAIAKARP